MNWNNGPPDNTKLVTIGGDQNKLITIGDSAGAATMTVSNLFIGAGANTTNTVLFNRTDTTPLEILRDFQLGNVGNGRFVMDTTSSLIVTNPNGGANSGRIGLANTVGRSGEFVLSNGTVRANIFLGDGANDSQATLRIAGGSMSVTNFQVGSSGTGTVWVTGGQLTVTNAANTATFIIANAKVGSMTVSGGVVQVRALTIANTATGVGTVTVAGGDLQALSTTANNTVGSSGTGTFQMLSGTAKFQANLLVGNNAGGQGTLNVQGGSFTVLSNLVVGNSGQGVFIMTGGTASAGPNGNMTVGANNGSSGTLNVQGGVLSALNGLIVGANATATGQVFVSGTGSLFVTNASQSSALQVGRTGIGTFTMNGGQVTADRLIVTNSGVNVPSFIFNSGVLNVRTSMVANGSAFVVGNGTDSATLNLLGGGHNFANGLTIANSATLKGIGTINAAVTVNNGGIVAPGSSAGTFFAASLTLSSGSVLNYELGTTNGINDFIQIDGNLTLAGTLNIADLGGFTNGTYLLITYGGTLTDNGLIVGTVPNGLSASIDTTVPGQINLEVIPEPSALALVVVGLAASCVLLRRRQQTSNKPNAMRHR